MLVLTTKNGKKKMDYKKPVRNHIFLVTIRGIVSVSIAGFAKTANDAKSIALEAAENERDGYHNIYVELFPMHRFLNACGGSDNTGEIIFHIHREYEKIYDQDPMTYGADYGITVLKKINIHDGDNNLIEEIECEVRVDD